MKQFLADLNKPQRRAVSHGLSSKEPQDERPLLVIPGAGSGKTKTLSCRVAYLIINSVDSAKILLLAFGRLAAHEMIGRAKRIIAGVTGRQDLHVGVAGRQPHSHPLRKWDHDCARTFRTRSSAAASTPLSMITRDPPSSAISIRPGDAHDEDSEVSAGIVGAGNDGGLLAEHASLTIAGANAVVSSVATSPPSRAKRRHVNNWLADSPFRRAVTDTSRGPP